MNSDDPSSTDHSKCRDREYELQEQIRWLKNQITYLQEELADTEDQLNEANRKLKEIDENGI
ncbi:MAG: hypothetical protein ABIG35_01215 [Pseudomonadota bacterium]